jgi:protoporphyrinogen oxidase
MMAQTVETLILGGGLAGLATARWMKPESYLVLEAQGRLGGHLCSDVWEERTWDQGPHVSFTKNSFVRDLLATDIDNDFVEFDAHVLNFDTNAWLPHPVQSHLYALPHDRRTAVINSFRQRPHFISGQSYAEWLKAAYGQYMAEVYMGRYTRKYWTCEASDLAIDWIGPRMRVPDEAEFLASESSSILGKPHYISTVRYPRNGGFSAYLPGFTGSVSTLLNCEVKMIDLAAQRVETSCGSFHYERLINSIPLPLFIQHCKQATPEILAISKQLHCTSLWLIDVAIPHPARVNFHWSYVYDNDKLSTRLTNIGALAPSNVPENQSGIQVEVYDSAYRKSLSAEEVQARVVSELLDMQLIDSSQRAKVRSRIRRIKYANVIFDRSCKENLETIWSWAQHFGLQRELHDTLPLTEWSSAQPLSSRLAFAGRFGQWKYFWTDDCILRGRQLAGVI